jgi:predicted XRE-type DNA-binding protein
VGKGVEEICVTDDDGWFRVLYTARLADYVYVLHASEEDEPDLTKRHRTWEEAVQGIDGLPLCKGFQMNTTSAPKTAHLRKAPVVALAKHRPAKKAPVREVAKVFASVFDAVADTEEEAANLKARAELARQITASFRERGWTQEEAARHCRVTQPRISDLMNGRISKFSLDALVNIASSLGRVSVELRELEPA